MVMKPSSKSWVVSGRLLTVITRRRTRYTREAEHDIYWIVMYSFAYFALVRIDQLIMILPGLFTTPSLWNIIYVISVI